MSGQKKYVLFLTSWYPSRIQALLGNFVQRHAEAAATSNEIILLYAVGDPSLVNRFELETKHQGSVLSYTVYFRETGFGLSKIRKFLALIKGWNEIKKNHGSPQLIHLNIAYPAGLVALWIKWSEGIKYVITEHWTMYLSENVSRLHALEFFFSKLIFRNAEWLLPVSKNLGDSIQHSFSIDTPVKVIPNAVNMSIFYPAAEKVKRDVTQILHVSTLHEPAKNVNGILRTLAKISSIRKDFVLHIIHDVPSPEHVALVKSLGIDEHVQFHGAKSMQEVADFMRKSDFVLLFSNFENLPVVLLESLACGVPVISTNVGGIAEHISDEFGILVQKQNEKELESALVQMLNHSASYDSKKLHRYALTHFGYDIIGSNFSEIYRQYIHD